MKFRTFGILYATFSIGLGYAAWILSSQNAKSAFSKPNVPKAEIVQIKPLEAKQAILVAASD